MMRSRDTTESAERFRIERLREMSYAERAACARGLTLGVQHLAFAGMRQMYPDASDDEIWLRLAVRRLGPETVRKVYGWVPEHS